MVGMVRAPEARGLFEGDDVEILADIASAIAIAAAHAKDLDADGAAGNLDRKSVV